MIKPITLFSYYRKRILNYFLILFCSLFCSLFLSNNAKAQFDFEPIFFEFEFPFLSKFQYDDLNGDRKADLVGLVQSTYDIYGTARLYTYFYDEEQALVQAGSIPLFLLYQVFNFDLYDVDHDGDKDIVIVYSDPDKVVNFRVCKNDGTGRFSVGEPINTGIMVTLLFPYMELFDYNNDGNLDVFVSGLPEPVPLVTYHQYWYIFLGDGEGNYIRQELYPPISGEGRYEICKWVDFDQDGVYEHLAQKAYLNH